MISRKIYCLVLMPRWCLCPGEYGSHPNGMSQFPFNMVHRNIVGNMNEVCFSNSDNDFESGNPDDLYSNENQINIMNSTDN